MKNGFSKIKIKSISDKIIKNKAIETIINNTYVNTKLTSFDVSVDEIEKHLSFLICCVNDFESEKLCVEKKCNSKLNNFWNDFYVEKNKIYHTLRPCKCLITKKGKWATLYNNNIINLDNHFKEAKLADFDTSTDARQNIKMYFSKFLDAYPKRIKGLFIMGGNGWGKTFALAAFANELFEKEKDIMILDCKTNFDELKNTHSKEYFKIIRNKYKLAKVLIIDGLGEESSTIFNRDYVLYPIIQHRFKNKKHTIFSSRYSLEKLEKQYGKDNKRLEAKMLINLIQKQTIPVILSKYL